MVALATWMLPEKRRAYTALASLVVTLPVAFLLIRGSTLETLTQASFGSSLVILVGYQAIYVLVTIFALAVVPWSTIAAWAESTSEGTLRTKYLEASDPGIGLAALMSVMAMIGTVVLSRSSSLSGSVSTGWTVLMSVTLIGLAWVTLVLTFTFDYLCRDARNGWSEFQFPGADQRRTSDYFYFAASVSTTFGTTDVDVLTGRMRANVAAHGVLAFVFNTVIIAVSLSLLAAT